MKMMHQHHHDICVTCVQSSALVMGNGRNNNLTHTLVRDRACKLHTEGAARHSNLKPQPQHQCATNKVCRIGVEVIPSFFALLTHTAAWTDSWSFWCQTAINRQQDEYKTVYCSNVCRKGTKHLFFVILSIDIVSQETISHNIRTLVLVYIRFPNLLFCFAVKNCMICWDEQILIKTE